MPLTYYGPWGENYKDYAHAGNANLGRWPLGHRLILPDQREYKFALNDGTAEIAGNLYQSVAAVSNHTDLVPDVVRAIGATTLSATLGATAAAVDIYAEGVAHINDDTGEGYSYRIRRAMTAGTAHASVATSSILTVNLEPGESVQVALTTVSTITLTRNRYHQALITATPPTGAIVGVSPGVAAANRFYWSQVKGYAAVYTDTGTGGLLYAGLPVQASITTAGTVEAAKRRVRSSGTTVAFLSVTGFWGIALTDAAGSAITGLYAISSVASALAAATYDITSGITYNAPPVGVCVKANTTTEYSLVDLNII